MGGGEGRWGMKKVLGFSGFYRKEDEYSYSYSYVYEFFFINFKPRNVKILTELDGKPKVLTSVNDEDVF